jgi:small subunit ribosomal protein S8
MKVMSKPSVRMYSSAKQIPKILGGLGAVILTTSKGIMSDKKARSLNIGGELLFSIW